MTAGPRSVGVVTAHVCHDVTRIDYSREWSCSKRGTVYSLVEEQTPPISERLNVISRQSLECFYTQPTREGDPDRFVACTSPKKQGDVCSDMIVQRYLKLQQRLQPTGDTKQLQERKNNRQATHAKNTAETKMCTYLIEQHVAVESQVLAAERSRGQCQKKKDCQSYDRLSRCSLGKA